jgi:hypothetical protein
LDSPLGIGKCPFFLQAGAGRQHHIGEAAGIAEEGILHHKELELGQAVINKV